MLLVFLLILNQLQQVASAKDPETLLLEKLLLDYGELDRRVRPKPADGDITAVNLGVELAQLIEVHEAAESLKLSVWVHMDWIDSRLAWNLTEYKGVKKINMKSGEVWTPDIVLFNSVDNEKLHMNKMETDIGVHHNGMLWWSSPMVVETRCDIDVSDFPFDIQHCYLKFSSWTHSVERMNVTGVELDLSYFNSNQGWKLTDAEVINEFKKYPDGMYSDVDFHFVLTRRSMFYMINLIFPIVLITLLAILTFLLPAQSGERLGVSVTMMLTVTVFMLLITEMIPKSSLNVAIVEVFFVFCLILIILVIVVSVFISRIYNRTSSDPPMGCWTRMYIFEKLSYWVYARHDHQRKNQTKSVHAEHCHHHLKENDSHEDEVGIKNGGLTISKTNTDKVNYVEKEEDTETYTLEEEWAVVGKTYDHCFFALFLLVFIIGTIGCFVEAKYIH